MSGFSAEPGQIQQHSGESSEKVPGSFGAKPSQGQVPEKVAEKVPEKVLRIWVQGQVRFNGFRGGLHLRCFQRWLRSMLQKDF